MDRSRDATVPVNWVPVPTGPVDQLRTGTGASLDGVTQKDELNPIGEDIQLGEVLLFDRASMR